MKTNLKILWEEIYVPVLWISLGETSQVTCCNPKEETFAFEAHEEGTRLGSRYTLCASVSFAAQCEDELRPDP